MELDVDQAVLLGPGEGERLGEHIVVKVELPEVSVNEVSRTGPFEGAGPHFHKEHVDVFYVLEGELDVINGAETVRAGPGTSVVVPPGVVHGFRGPGDARYLNIRADGGTSSTSAGSPATASGSTGASDIDEPQEPADAIVAGPDGGERLERRFLHERDQGGDDADLALRADVRRDVEGVDRHSHDDHIDSFFVLEGEVDFLLEGRTVRAGADSYVAAPLNVTHGFRPVAPARFSTSTRRTPASPGEREVAPRYGRLPTCGRALRPGRPRPRTARRLPRS